MATSSDGGEKRRPRAAFMAFGTKGDVHPIAALAAGFAKAKDNYTVYFISHAAHEGIGRILASLNIEFVSVQSPPVVSVNQIGQSEAMIGLHQSESSDEDSTVACNSTCHLRLEIEQRHREQCLKAIDSIFGSSENAPGSFIIINFFALEGWHLAELYQIPCGFAAAYVVPYSAPVTFERRFQSAHPLLYNRLKRAKHWEVGWDDVIHWMWPIFTERWTEWRSQRLRLSACPLTDPVTELPVIQHWPLKPPLLYGFSEEVVECPSYWPQNVHVCGFWFFSEHWFGSDGSIDNIGSFFTSKLTEFLRGCDIAPIFIGLSSIGSMGLIDNPEGLLCVLRDVLRKADRKAILFTAAYSPLDAAVMAVAAQKDLEGSGALCYHLSKRENGMIDQTCGLNSSGDPLSIYDGRLFCFSGSIPYLWLFPKCSVILHHGGSGTTAAALYSGVPQIICPFVLDQFYWAERMAWIGVAPNPLKKQNLVPPMNSSTDEAVSILLNAIEEASTSEMQTYAAAFGERIRKEDGISKAVAILCKEMHV